MLEQLAKFMFILSVVVTLAGGGYIYGVFSHRKQLFPISWVRAITTDLKELLFPYHKKFLSTDIRYSNPSVEIHPSGLLIVRALSFMNGTFGGMKYGARMKETFQACFVPVVLEVRIYTASTFFLMEASLLILNTLVRFVWIFAAKSSGSSTTLGIIPSFIRNRGICG
jgi:hypothetical protein